MCTMLMGSKYATCLVLGTKRCSVARILTPPTASGELVGVSCTTVSVEGESCLLICHTAPMPTDYEKYFSFGQFAIEMNELEEGLRDQLPRTDCRFRPDQR